MSIPPPIPARAPAIAVQVREAEAALGALQARTAGLAFARAEQQAGAGKAYADHEVALATAKADLGAKVAAFEHAQELDRRTADERVRMLRNADPADLMEGLSSTDCCDGCSATECLLAPGVSRCAHPAKGGLAAQFFNDPVLRSIQSVAREELAAQARGDYDDDETEAA